MFPNSHSLGLFMPGGWELLIIGGAIFGSIAVVALILVLAILLVRSKRS